MSLEGKTAEEIAQLAELAQSLGTNPKTRLGFLQLTKNANPDISIPEIDIPNSMYPAFQKSMERLGKLEQENADMKMEKSVLSKRSALLANDKLNVTQKDIPAIEKLMVEKGIPDHNTAAEFYQMQQKAATPTPAQTTTGQRHNPVPTMDLKPFSGNINQWAQQTARDTIDSIRAGQIKLA